MDRVAREGQLGEILVAVWEVVAADEVCLANPIIF